MVLMILTNRLPLREARAKQANSVSAADQSLVDFRRSCFDSLIGTATG
ncbi:hypothetical protein JYQ62_36750 [Nostoc sp. UHCC 0702]|nr:hypothetical protein JYQ62_36750 [Nostoc sp. UHCC 0702]